MHEMNEESPTSIYDGFRFIINYEERVTNTCVAARIVLFGRFETYSHTKISCCFRVLLSFALCLSFPSSPPATYRTLDVAANIQRPTSGVGLPEGKRKD